MTENIFIHGWSFSKDIWKNFFHLENSIFFDLPYHGDNKKIYVGSILDQFSKDISNYILKRKINVNLVGWSLGATVSMKVYFLTEGKYINKLILIGFSPKFNDRTVGHDPIRIKAFLVALKKDFANTIFNFRKAAVDKEFPEIPTPEEKGAIKLLKEFIKADFTDTLKDIKASTILIHGTKDKIINPQASIYTKKNIKNSKLILVDNHHAPFLENKDIILDYIK